MYHKKKKDETHFARVNALIPFCCPAISVLQQYFIAASSLTAAMVTRHAASTSEWKIRVFTGDSERGRKGGRYGDR